jgi:hypothetical protein
MGLENQEVTPEARYIRETYYIKNGLLTQILVMVRSGRGPLILYEGTIRIVAWCKDWAGFF